MKTLGVERARRAGLPGRGEIRRDEYGALCSGMAVQFEEHIGDHAPTHLVQYSPWCKKKSAIPPTRGD